MKIAAVSVAHDRTSWRSRIVNPEPVQPIDSALIPSGSLDSWEDAFSALPNIAPSALSRARLTMAASVAHGLRSLPPAQLGALSVRARGRNGRVLVWIVGAREAMEGELARGGHLAEPLAALCPPALASRGLELALIGPEMDTWEFSVPNPIAAGAPSLLVRGCSGTLHALQPSSADATVDAAAAAAGPPDVAVLFNSGIGTLLWPLVEGWLPTIAQLLSYRDVPLLLTCFNEHEARGEEVGHISITPWAIAETPRRPRARQSPSPAA